MSNDITEQAREVSLSEFLKKRLRDIMNEHADHIATGSCKDLPEYKKLCGVI